MDIKADHRAARLGVDINLIDIQRVYRKNLAVGFPLRRRRAAVAGLTKIGAGLNGLFR